MMIKAIETIYKGYRFRSRLEARWAVFFDEHGTEWQYEVEGFELPSGRYLPDFYLPMWKTYVEVKPPPFLSQHTPPKVYMAGRMRKPCWRPFDVNHIEYPDYDQVDIIPKSINGSEIWYSGPYRSNYHDHCGIHGVDDCGCSERSVLNRSLKGIHCCDVFFALFDDLESYGTLVEVGYAKAIGKQIFIGFADNLPIDPTMGPVDRTNTLWFAAASADKVSVGSVESILADFCNWISRDLPSEQQKAKELSSIAECRASVVYGDPVQALDQDGGGIVDFLAGKSDYPLIYSWGNQETSIAALAGRQARFEYGQSGAPT